MTNAAEQLIDYCREGGRVCPMPSQWNRLWELLPERRRSGVGWQPPLPLILAAWEHSSDLQKMLRLAEHIEWAETRGALDQVSDFLRTLPEEEWHHL